MCETDAYGCCSVGFVILYWYDDSHQGRIAAAIANRIGHQPEFSLVLAGNNAAVTLIPVNGHVPLVAMRGDEAVGYDGLRAAGDWNRHQTGLDRFPARARQTILG